MKAVVFLSLICACAAMPQLYIADTADVLAEKQRFFQLYNAAAKAAADAPDINVHHTPRQTHTPQTYTTNHNVIHRFAVPHQPTHHQQHHHTPQYTPKWTGPVAATIPAGLPGSAPQVPNTPEVDAAIANFNRAYSNALVATRSSAPSPQQYQSYTPNQATHRFTAAQPAYQPKWTGPVAATVPAGLPGSVHQVGDTPEVLAAKAQFSRAFQNQLSHVFG